MPEPIVKQPQPEVESCPFSFFFRGGSIYQKLLCKFINVWCGRFKKNKTSVNGLLLESTNLKFL